MAATSRKQEIQRQAVKLLQTLKVEKAPVPVERIAKHLGAHVRYSALDDEISGMVYINAGTPVIGVNLLHHPNRQRFTVAHEIGHLVLHRPLVTSAVHVDRSFKVLKRDNTASLGIHDVEIEANQFAAELLMPRFLLSVALGDDLIDVDDEQFLKNLATQFKVSRQAMTHRLNAVLEPLG
jgi:Zn-dependent peptidase ImmA (M78 family)